MKSSIKSPRRKSRSSSEYSLNASSKRRSQVEADAEGSLVTSEKMLAEAAYWVR